MRLHLILFLLTSTIFVAAANHVKTQNVTLEAKATPVYKVFRQIEKQTGFLFFYKGKMLDKNIPITINVVNSPLKNTLDKIFAQLPLTYEIVEETIVVKEKPVAQQKEAEQEKK